MAMFGRRKRSRYGVPELRVSRDELTATVEEGMLIARLALVLSLANRLIVRALHEGADFDREAAAEAARDEVDLLIQEHRRDADRMARTRAKASRAFGISRHQHDYRPEDDLPLQRRELSYTMLADELEKLRDDEDALAPIIEDARDRAWNDIGQAVLNRLRGLGPVDENYDAERHERLWLLREVDLRELRYQHRKKQAADRAVIAPRADPGTNSSG